MDQTTKTNEPLLSDEEMEKWEDTRKGGKGGIGFKWTATKVRDLYESDRAKTRAVVQKLVNFIDYQFYLEPRNTKYASDYYFNGGINALECLALAKSELNIEPTKP